MLQSQTPTELEWNLFRQSVRTETSTSFRLLDTGFFPPYRGLRSNPHWKILQLEISHVWPAIPDLVMVNPQSLMASWHGFIAPFLPWHQARQEISQVSATLEKVEKLLQELQDWAGGDRISSPNCHTKKIPPFS